MSRLNGSGAGFATDRRTFIQAGAASVAVLAGPMAAAGALARAPNPVVPYKAVFDTRYAESVAFAREMTRRGVATAGLEGDVTALWYDDLYHRWKEGPTTLAGLTDSATLFCLETLANDAGMRVAFRSEYRAANGLLRRRTEGPQTLLELIDGVPKGDAWGPGVAGLVLACASTASTPFVRGASTAVCAPPSPSAAHLTAWVIAPIKRA